MNSNDNNPTDSSKPVQPSFAEGQKLAGCYVLRRRVDAGGGVDIWLAHDQVLGKDVSLHFIPQEIRAVPATMDAVRQEVKRNRQLIHPNILRVYDFVEEADWSAISMDWFEGESLASVLARRPAGFFEPVDIKAWTAQLCATLDDAHKVQLVHRDISLTNIFVEKSGKILVANFGISRLLQDALGRLRGPEEAAAGMAFMSPQQLDGERASSSDDVYSFGALVQTLLVGEPPFTVRDIVAKIRRTVPLSISERRAQLKKSGAVIPASWEKTTAACLEKSPEQRPAGMAEVASRLMIEKPAGALESAPPVVAVTESVPANEAVAAVPAIGLGAAKSGLRPVDVLRAKAKAAEEAEAAGPVIVPPFVKPAEPAINKSAKPLAEKPPTPPKSEQDAIPEHFPSFTPRRSGFPLTGVAAGIILVGVTGYLAFFYPGEKNNGSASDPGGVEREGASDLAPVANVLEGAPVSDEALPDKSDSDPLPTPDAVNAPLQVVQITPAPTPANVDKGTTDVSAATAALEKAKHEAEAAEKQQAEMLKQQKQAEAAAADAKKQLEEKTKTAVPVQKAAADVATLLQKRDEEMRSAQAAADEAQKAAAEKAKLAEDAKKAYDTVAADGREKLAMQQKSDTELKALGKAIEDKQRVATEMEKSIADAAEKLEEQKTAIKRSEQDLAEAKMAAQKVAEEMAAKKAAEEAARMAMEKRHAVETEIEETKRLFAEKMKALEDMLNKGSSTPPAPEPSGKPDAPAAKPGANAKPAADVKPVAATAPPAETLLAMKTEAAKPGGTQKTAVVPGGVENSLGMKFVPVGDVMFSVFQTRVKEFETFAKETGLKSTLWKDPGFKQGPDHPVVNVTWQEAMTFCKWLSAKEHKDGKLGQNQAYRLPTDLEWSKAVGLPEESGRTPEARDMGVPEIYPWGSAWPPPPGAGNYTGEETGSDVAIKGYDDGYAWTSPVGSFQPNKYGLYDMGGNVWQWCMDSWNSDQKAKVLRGASWYNGALKLSLLSSCRVHAAPDSSTDNYGFRCVIASGDSGKTPKK